MSVLSTFVQDEDGLESTIAIILNTLKKHSNDTTEPWALVIAKDDEFVKNELSRRFYQKPDDRAWFDSIQICRIDDVNQLKIKLCSLHVAVQEQKNDILDIIEYEKHGQPPSMIIVISLIDYLTSHSFNELNNLLACLLETCIYLSSKMNHSIELLLTGDLPCNTSKLYQILNYHLDHVYIQNARG